MRTRKKGFTLVELSIVLVIIGLLIGGILIAQSMVSTAKLQKVIRQLGQYEAAVKNFQTKFNQLPGDTNLFTDPGDNNGRLTNWETNAFWYHLSLGVGLENPKNGKDFLDYRPYTYDNTPKTDVTDYFPVFDLQQNKHDAIYLSFNAGGCWTSTASVDLASAKCWMYNERSVLYTSDTYAPLRASDVQALDIKLDDGFPSAGKVLGGGVSGSGACALSGYKYDTSAGSYCNMTIFFGAVTSMDTAT